MYTTLSKPETNEIFKKSSIVTTLQRWKETDPTTQVNIIYLRNGETQEKTPAFSFCRTLENERSVITEIKPFENFSKETLLEVYERVLAQFKNHAKQFSIKRLIIFTDDPIFLEAMIGHGITIVDLDKSLMGTYEL